MALLELLVPAVGAAEGAAPEALALTCELAACFSPVFDPFVVWAGPLAVCPDSVVALASADLWEAKKAESSPVLGFWVIDLLIFSLSIVVIDSIIKL